MLNNRVWDKLDGFIGYNGENNLRFGIGAAYGDFSLTSVKAVSKNQAWQTSAAKDCAVDFTDESSELYSAAGNSAFTTTALYDVAANDVEFVMPKKGNDEFLFVGFGVDTADGSVSNRGLIFRESGYSYSGIMNDVNLNGWSDVKDGAFNFTLSPNQKHTFGVREKYGSYYPAVDGEILMPSTFDDEMQSVYDDFSNFVKLSNGKVRFVIADFSSSSNTIADVKIVSTVEEPPVTLDKDTFIQHLGYDVGERDAVYKQDDGAYSISAENNGSFLSYSTYDLNNTALSFKYPRVCCLCAIPQMWTETVLYPTGRCGSFWSLRTIRKERERASLYPSLKTEFTACLIGLSNMKTPTVCLKSFPVGCLWNGQRLTILFKI